MLIAVPNSEAGEFLPGFTSLEDLILKSKLYVIHNLANFWATDLVTLHCQELGCE